MSGLVWRDGDPLMEAIAAAVYERCETGDGGIVHDDPRNVAAAAAQAAVTILGRDRCTCRQSAHARHHTDGPVPGCPWCMTRDHADPTPPACPGPDTVQTGGLL